MNLQCGWRQLADLHRPPNVAGMKAAILDLHRQGLKPRDIAEALRLDVWEVQRALHSGKPA